MSLDIFELDFDGTITDIDRETIPAIQGWKRDLAKLMDYSPDRMEARWTEAERKILADPHAYGWKRDGRIVGPSASDPFLLATSINIELFDQEGLYTNDDKERQDVMHKIFFANHHNIEPSFKRGADEFLTDMKERYKVHIVTNSKADSVEKKLRLLAHDHTDIKVHDGANKYDVHPDWTPDGRGLPYRVHKQGFGRALEVRRKDYWESLTRIMDREDAAPENVAVVGDIYEFDLLLPELLGMRTVLVPRGRTSQAEVEAVRDSPRGYVATDLWDVREHLASNTHKEYAGFEHRPDAHNA